MKRPLVTLLLALAAIALMAPRPSVNQLNTRVNQLEADQTRQDDEIQLTQDATCAAADVEGDTYRPAFCPARCTGVQPPSSGTCELTASGFQVVRSASFDGSCLDPPGSPSTCNYRSTALEPNCSTDADCPGSSVCDTSVLSEGVCLLATACTFDSDCPQFFEEDVVYACSGIGVAGDLAPAECGGGITEFVTIVPINSSDGLACRSDVEAQIGACQ